MTVRTLPWMKFAPDRCNLCSPERGKCRQGWLYVVVDSRDGSFKIGQTVQQPSQRLRSYNSNNCCFFRLAHQRRAGCQWTSSRFENDALRLLASKAYNVRGDWFVGDIDDAITVIEHVCRGLPQ